MATVFDRETLLDLVVNVVPLGIILFFSILFVVFNPWRGLGTFGFIIHVGLLIVPLVSLAVLTYVSGKAIAGDERRAEVYHQGQAAMADAPTRAETEAEREAEERRTAERQAAEREAEERQAVVRDEGDEGAESDESDEAGEDPGAGVEEDDATETESADADAVETAGTDGNGAGADDEEPADGADEESEK